MFWARSFGRSMRSQVLHVLLQLLSWISSCEFVQVKLPSHAKYRTISNTYITYNQSIRIYYIIETLVESGRCFIIFCDGKCARQALSYLWSAREGRLGLWETWPTQLSFISSLWCHRTLVWSDQCSWGCCEQWCEILHTGWHCNLRFIAVIKFQFSIALTIIHTCASCIILCDTIVTKKI